MREEEATARALEVLLRAIGVDARVTGAGVHWRVEVALVGSREFSVHCFWYSEEQSGLFLGINPANQRSRLRGYSAPVTGAEYAVVLRDAGRRIAEGRTRIVEDVVSSARGWLGNLELDRLVREVPFVDERPRAMRGIAEQLDPRLCREIGEGPWHELWVYGDDRSCRVVGRAGAPTCSFLVGQAQVALGAALDDVPSAIESWLIDRSSLGALARRFPGVEQERHADVLESDPARWHWLHVRDRIADVHDALAPLRELIEALAASPIAAVFFSRAPPSTTGLVRSRRQRRGRLSTVQRERPPRRVHRCQRTARRRLAFARRRRSRDSPLLRGGCVARRYRDGCPRRARLEARGPSVVGLPWPVPHRGVLTAGGS